MKKTIGLLAAIGAAAAVVVYKMKKNEEDKATVELDAESERILRSAEEKGFEPIDYEDKESSNEYSFPNLDESELAFLNQANEETFQSLENVDSNVEYPVQHSVKFDSENDLEDFKNEVISEGYVVTTGEEENELLVLHISKMDQDDISTKVFHLADLAKANNGIYEGWICKQ